MVPSEKTDANEDKSGRQSGAGPWNLPGADPSAKPSHSCFQTAVSAAMHLCFGETNSEPKNILFPSKPSFDLQPPAKLLSCAPSD